MQGVSKTTGIGLAIFAAAAIAAVAQENLAKQSQNPLGTIISSPFENNTYLNIGPSDATANVLLWKPVYPASLGGWRTNASA